MSFRPDKCSVVRVTAKHNRIKFHNILHQTVLQKETSTKYLGVTIQTIEMEQTCKKNIPASAT
jgi:hypothetical protein